MLLYSSMFCPVSKQADVTEVLTGAPVQWLRLIASPWHFGAGITVFTTENSSTWGWRRWGWAVGGCCSTYTVETCLPSPWRNIHQTDHTMLMEQSVKHLHNTPHKVYQRHYWAQCLEKMHFFKDPVSNLPVSIFVQFVSLNTDKN